jgi:hypothetical protein
MQKLYKKLECENLQQINNEILSYINSRKFDPNSFWNPVDVLEFMKVVPSFAVWFLDNQMPIKSVAITQAHAPNCCTLHTDTPPSRYKLSWPVLNTKHSWNRWFEPMPDAPTKQNSLGGTDYLDYSKMIEIDRMCVDSPAIIATHVPHDVWFEENAVFPRWGLQCQLFVVPETL